MVIDREISYEEDAGKFPTFKPKHFPLEAEAIELSKDNVKKTQIGRASCRERV